MSGFVRRLVVPRWSAVVAALAVLVLRWQTDLVHWSFNDLHVYQRAGRAVLNGSYLYLDPYHRLQFTYPPFAAALFVPLSVIGFVAGAVVITLVSLRAYLAIVAMCGTTLRMATTSTALLAGICLAYEPVLRTLRLGQINLLLLVLVVVDALVIRSRLRGVLIGIAAGVKVVPGVLILYFLISGDRRSALRAFGALLATIGLSAIWTPRAAWDYWTHLVVTTGRVGNIAFVDNQALAGIVARLMHTEHPPMAITAPLALGSIALALVAGRRQIRAGRQLAGLTCVAVGGLLASPISWSHHWVWLVPMTMVLVADRRRVLACVVALVAVVAPAWLTPTGPRGYNPELHDALWQQLAVAAIPLMGVAYLVLMVVATRPTIQQPAPITA